MGSGNQIKPANQGSNSIAGENTMNIAIDISAFIINRPAVCYRHGDHIAVDDITFIIELPAL